MMRVENYNSGGSSSVHYLFSSGKPERDKTGAVTTPLKVSFFPPFLAFPVKVEILSMVFCKGTGYLKYTPDELADHPETTEIKIFTGNSRAYVKMERTEHGFTHSKADSKTVKIFSTPLILTRDDHLFVIADNIEDKYASLTICYRTG